MSYTEQLYFLRHIGLQQISTFPLGFKEVAT